MIWGYHYFRKHPYPPGNDHMGPTEPEVRKILDSKLRYFFGGSRVPGNPSSFRNAPEVVALCIRYFVYEFIRMYVYIYNMCIIYIYMYIYVYLYIHSTCVTRMIYTYYEQSIYIYISGNIPFPGTTYISILNALFHVWDLNPKKPFTYQPPSLGLPRRCHCCINVLRRKCKVSFWTPKRQSWAPWNRWNPKSQTKIKRTSEFFPNGGGPLAGWCFCKGMIYALVN